MKFCHDRKVLFKKYSEVYRPISFKVSMKVCMNFVKIRWTKVNERAKVNKAIFSGNLLPTLVNSATVSQTAQFFNLENTWVSTSTNISQNIKYTACLSVCLSVCHSVSKSRKRFCEYQPIC